MEMFNTNRSIVALTVAPIDIAAMNFPVRCYFRFTTIKSKVKILLNSKSLFMAKCSSAMKILFKTSLVYIEDSSLDVCKNKYVRQS